RWMGKSMAYNLVIGIWADTSKLRGDLAIAAGRSPQKIRYDLKGAGFRKKAHAGRIEKQTYSTCPALLAVAALAHGPVRRRVAGSFLHREKKSGEASRPDTRRRHRRDRLPCRRSLRLPA